MTEPPPEQHPQQPQYGQALPPPPPAYTQQTYGPYTPEPPATNRATLALVLGIVGLTVCPGIASIPAWIIGSEAVKEIEASNGQLGGRSMAFAGKVTGIIGTVLAGLGLLAVGAVFVIGALLVDSVNDCQATGDDTTFSVHC
ncbi:MAG: DUF4190 domain-containing protein [Marmoricola sp.]